MRRYAVLQWLHAAAVPTCLHHTLLRLVLLLLVVVVLLTAAAAGARVYATVVIPRVAAA